MNAPTWGIVGGDTLSGVERKFEDRTYRANCSIRDIGFELDIDWFDWWADKCLGEISLDTRFNTDGDMKKTTVIGIEKRRLYNAAVSGRESSMYAWASMGW